MGVMVMKVYSEEADQNCSVSSSSMYNKKGVFLSKLFHHSDLSDLEISHDHGGFNHE
jgi:hypothetical protein